MKQILFFVFLSLNIISNAQYIGVRARYTDTRLVDDTPNPPKRENRLILSFFEVSPSGVYTPTVLTAYSIYVYKQGLQFGNVMGGVLDSTGNNYPGYNFPAPKVVSYYNTLGVNYIDCDPTVATGYVVNGHELDCGFVTVSYWDMDYGTMVPFEAFPAPNVCLTLYPFDHPYYYSPGNVNFSTSSVFPGPPYNMYNFHCGGPLQLVVRGLLPYDTSRTNVTLPVRFANVRATLVGDLRTKLEWSNMTETDINYYEIERSIDGMNFQVVGLAFPLNNNGSRADYTFFDDLSSHGTYHYRVKALENPGGVLYSQVVRLKTVQSLINTSILTIYPNPVSRGEVTIKVNDLAAGKYSLLLLNMTGQQVMTTSVNHAGGNFSIVQSLMSVAPGVYQLLLRSDSLTLSQKIFINR